MAKSVENEDIVHLKNKCQVSFKLDLLYKSLLAFLTPSVEVNELVLLQEIYYRQPTPAPP